MHENGSSVQRERLTRGAVCGLAAGAAFAAVMLVDLRLSGRRVNDFQLLADFGPFSDKWPVVGPTVHGVNSIAVGALYSVVEPSLRGPGWLRGLSFALVENMLLWPILVVLDRIHPAIREGRLEKFNRPWPFVAETLRHGAFGLTLGYLFERSRPVN